MAAPHYIAGQHHSGRHRQTDRQTDRQKSTADVLTHVEDNRHNVERDTRISYTTN